CESLCHPAFVYLAAIYAGSHDRGTVLGVFQMGNSIGRSLFPIIHGRIFDYNWRLCYLIASLYPIIGFVLVSLCPFRLT
ncbi:major facilitator superfamily protein, partial [Kipferlia bialata]